MIIIGIMLALCAGILLLLGIIITSGEPIISNLKSSIIITDFF